MPDYSFEEWVRWEGNWEPIEGIPIALIPLPRRRQLINLNICAVLRNALKEPKAKKCYIYPAIAYKVSDDTIIHPGILIVCAKIEKDYLDFPPILAVEVLSPETALWDRNTNYEIYWQQGDKILLDC